MLYFLRQSGKKDVQENIDFDHVTLIKVKGEIRTVQKVFPEL